MEYGGILGVVVLIVDIWAIVNVLGSGITGAKKALWIIGILLLPLLGAILWLAIGPRSGTVSA